VIAGRIHPQPEVWAAFDRIYFFLRHLRARVRQIDVDEDTSAFDVTDEFPFPVTKP
jgi:hypothetical protein